LEPSPHSEFFRISLIQLILNSFSTGYTEVDTQVLSILSASGASLSLTASGAGRLEVAVSAVDSPSQDGPQAIDQVDFTGTIRKLDKETLNL
jgi:hypothetical protein